MGTQISLRSIAGIVLGSAIWLCPFWLAPTPSVMPLVWGAMCLGIWLLIEVTRKQDALAEQRIDPLFWLLLAGLAAMIAWRSRDLPNTLVAALCLAGIGFATSLSAQLHVTKTAHVIAWGWLLAGLVNAAFGLAQYFGFTTEPTGTAFGFLRQRNQLATLCNIALLSLLYLWLVRSIKAGAEKDSFTLPLAAIACLTLTAALVATCSRAGLLELLCLSLIGLIYAARQRQQKLFFAILFALLSYAAWAWLLPIASGNTETVFGRVASLATFADGVQGVQLQDERRLLWANTASLVQAEPWLGVGWRELANSLRTTDFGLATRFSQQADNAHNIPLHFAAELGVPFTVLWFGLLAYLLIKHKPWCPREPAQVLAWGVLAVIGIHSLLEYPLWYAPFQIAVGLSAGLLFMQHAPILPRQGNSLVSLAGYGLAGMSLLCFCAYTAFDYNRVRQLYVLESERWPVYSHNTFDKVKDSWLFAAQVRFAKLTTTPIAPENAAELWLLGHEVLHFSPEPLVFKALIQAGEWLALNDPKIAIELAVLKKQLKAIEE